MRFNEQFIKRVTPNARLIHPWFPEEINFSVDSRTLRAGDVFIALKGEQCDGHDFIVDALRKGAAGLVVHEQKSGHLKMLKDVATKLVISVADPIDALVRWATVWRTQFDYPVVGVTGSVGKTSTKELLSRVLDLYGTPHLASHGNQNTRLGVSLNIMRMRATHEAAILELGVNKRGEMKELARIVRPTTAVITNVGHAHMEGFGSLADIAAEKRAIFSHFSEKNIGIINGDQPLLAQIGYAHPVIKFGAKTTNQIQARKMYVGHDHVSFTLKIYQERHRIVLKGTHTGPVFNALAVTAVAHQLGIPTATIVQGIQAPIVVAGRFEERSLKPYEGAIINDCYNANPESMKASLLAFQKIDTKAQKIAVLGDMLELGVNSPFWHRQLGRFLRKVPSLKHVILVGDLVNWMRTTLPVRLSVEVVPTWQEAVRILEQRLQQESLVLVKGSFGVGLGNLVNHFTK